MNDLSGNGQIRRLTELRKARTSPVSRTRIKRRFITVFLFLKSREAGLEEEAVLNDLSVNGQIRRLTELRKARTSPVSRTGNKGS